MADIYTDRQDEDLIQTVLLHGLEMSSAPKWTVLRLALAKSLQIPTEPDESLDRPESRGSEYHLEQVTGLGQTEDEQGAKDYTDAIRALLCVHHSEDLFQQDDKRFRQLLQRHIRRGLREIRTSWRAGHDFHAYLYQELFAGVQLRQETPNVAEDLLRALKDIGVSGEIRNTLQGPRITRYLVHLPDVNHLDRLRRGLEKLALSLGFQRQGVFLQPTDEARIVGLDVPRPRDTWQPIPGAWLREWVQQQMPPEELLPVWPGVDALGKPYHFDLTAAPHLLVAGTTGSGKSICLHALLLSLLWRYGPQDLQLCLIDPKKVEFAPYANLPHLILKQVFDEINSVVEVLWKAVEEMEARIEKMRTAGITNLAEGIENGRLRLPRIVIFVEELADLLMQSRETEEPLVRLAQKARSSGIHLVLATQRPDAETFSGLLRSNAPGRIALAVQKSSESRIILDETGAEKLLGRGDMLVKASPGAPPDRVHGVMINRDDIAACVRAAQGRI